MAVVEFQLSRKMIDWIASVGGVTTSSLAEQLMPKKQEQFLNGSVNKSTAEKLAKIGQIPFGYLFLEHPPEIKKPSVPDLRQTVNAVELSKDFFDTFNDIKYKIDWYKDHLREFGISYHLDFIGKFSLKHTPTEVAKHISKTIKLNIPEIIKNVTKESYFGVLCRLIEDAGILVFKNGVVKNNTRRKLDTDEFRGFCIIDAQTPAVFVNGSDAFSAQVFTLFHEVAHLWIGKEGVSNWNFESKIEAFCNKVAAEVIMPTELFQEKWKEELAFGMDSLFVITHVANYFKVSNYAAAIKAKNLNLINEFEFLAIRENSLKSKKPSKSGGNPYASFPYKNSPKLTDAILSSAVTQRTPLREAGNLLNIQASTVIELYKKRNLK